MRALGRFLPWLAVATSAAAQATPVTFHRDVAPILDRRCVECHRPGGPAPFSLASFRDARRRGRMIVDVVRSGWMPPWLPAPGHVALRGARTVPEGERATLERWLAGGMTEGDAADAPGPRRTFATGWRLGEPDLVVDAPDTVVVPAAGADRFRNLVIPVTLDRTRFVEAIEIAPGDARVVHHAILATDRTGDARRRDARDREPGFAGMDLGAAVAPDGHFIGWTPGKGATPSPSGAAWRLRPGTDLVLQLHLVPSGAVTSIRPRIALRFTDEPPTRRPYAVTLFTEDIDIPPGATAHRVGDRYTMPVDVDLFGFYPHAHYLATRIDARVTLPGRDPRPLFAIPAWNFDWQEDYRLATPMHLPKGSVVSFDCVYDNSADNPRNPNDPPARVRFGQRSVDEMATLTLIVIPRDPADWIRLEEARWRHRLAKAPGEADAWNGLARALVEQGRAAEATTAADRSLTLDERRAAPWRTRSAARLLADDPAGALAAAQRALRIDERSAGAWTDLGLAFVAVGEEARAVVAFRRALALEPNDVPALVNLAVRVAIARREDEAIALFERAAALAPDRPEIHNNLGNACFASGRTEAAVRAYRAAVRLRGDYFNAWLNLGRVLAHRGDTAGARDALERARALRPTDRAVREALAGLGPKERG